jgi:hypothetical protein
MPLNIEGKYYRLEKGTRFSEKKEEERNCALYSVLA